MKEVDDEMREKFKKIFNISPEVKEKIRKQIKDYEAKKK